MKEVEYNFQELFDLSTKTSINTLYRNENGLTLYPQIGQNKVHYRIKFIIDHSNLDILSDFFSCLKYKQHLNMSFKMVMEPDCTITVEYTSDSIIEFSKLDRYENELHARINDTNRLSDETKKSLLSSLRRNNKYNSLQFSIDRFSMRHSVFTVSNDIKDIITDICDYVSRQTRIASNVQTYPDMNMLYGESKYYITIDQPNSYKYGFFDKDEWVPSKPFVLD